MHTLEQLRAGELCGARHLKLAENLTEFPPEIFSLKETLEVLDLTGNQLSRLPDELAGFSKLRIIFCSENRFTELPEVLGRCPALTMVGFKANRIATVPAASLPVGLRWLILTDNAVEQLPDELGQCGALQKLMLSGNRLRELPASLANCQRLELVRIAANRLEALPDWLARLPRLAWLAYAGNPFSDKQEQRLGQCASVADIPWAALTVGELLGQGASGVIHRAELATPAGPRAVAVKCFKGAVTSDGLPRCELAVSLTAGRHPHLVGVEGRVGDHPSGIPALVMALIDPDFINLAGPPSLDSCTRDIYQADARFTPAALLAMAQGVASAALHLHGRGILHGDLYAHNMLHSSQGEGRLLLGDFGAASCYERTDGELAGLLERLEVRAFGCLLEELLARCAPCDDRLDALHVLVADCLAEAVVARPDFAEITGRLAAVAPVICAEPVLL
ncbi:serine/threonine-protein kinase [Aeromonas hydrophila]|uniref:leucine-rich repeat-containing protein kinase family protein n=1 Tax=Aeromonas hydrophila TaxID=644 RepID=UPI00191CCCCF|nr:leucine-rich repeat-containing protein kinase family protein [Aeromonas hydrophila]MBL0432204.1 serine/threonine-protein kinase [Aeromonas hydrophila]MBL0468175.1 serine/threonine-protein kinase [Aeromonas hydrophila]